MAETLKIHAVDGSGSFDAYVARPTGNQGPVIIALQEIFGVNAGMRQICDDLAEKGYIAICPDLFWRMKPGVDITDKTQEEWDEAFGYFQNFDHTKGMEDIAATVKAARTIEGGSGKVGAVGYCLGGLLAYKTAVETDADACVSYYGVGIETKLDEQDQITNPLLMHIAEEDGFVDKDAQAAIKNGLKNNTQITIYSYAGVDHAFARPDGVNWDTGAASLANSRTASFFETTLKA